jgi:GT2 family glycosyltransferase
VIVVDCASSDDTLAVARGRVTIPLSENVGYARGCNRGVAEVDEPVTLLVNPDVELLDDSLAALAAEALRRDRPERLLAPLVLYPDGSRQDTAHPRPGSPADLARALLPPAVLPSAALAPWRATRPRRIGWAVGCALIGRTGTLRRLGPFDERLFLYGEDLDLGLRAAAAGVETWFWPSARVLHHRAHATAAEFGGEPFDRLARTRREVIARRLGGRRARVDDAAQALTFATRIAGKRILGHPRARERAQLEALMRVRRG